MALLMNYMLHGLGLALAILTCGLALFLALELIGWVRERIG